VPQACDATIRIVDRIEPNAPNRDTYNEYYPIYSSLHRSLKPAFDAVAAVE
jgi:sugar (pentulose or hexulose) kinase